MADTTSTTPNAVEPFSGAAVDPDERFEPPSDIILRSSDAIDFHCHKNILAHVSPFFSDMFAAVSGNQDIQKDGKAVIPLVEHSAVLYGLLPRVYPAHKARPFTLTNPADLTDICPVHEAANKFQMVRAQALIEDMLFNSPLLETDPHRFFAIGCIRNIVPLIRKAALCTLRDTVNPVIPFIPEFEFITGNRALELSNFYQRCALRAQSVAGNTHSVHREILARAAEEPTVITSHEASGQPFVWWREEGHAAHCGPTHQMIGGVWTQEILPPHWYRNHVRQVSNALRFVPNGTTAQKSAVDVAVPERSAIAACPACAQYALHDLANFAAQLKKLIEWSNEEIADGTCSHQVCAPTCNLCQWQVVFRRAERKPEPRLAASAWVQLSRSEPGDVTSNRSQPGFCSKFQRNNEPRSRDFIAFPSLEVLWMALGWH